MLKKVIRNPVWGLQKIYLHGRSYLTINRGDVVLALFPKTGSTWIRYFLFSLLSDVELGNKEPSIDEMNRVMPEFGNPNLFNAWPFKSCPRIIKTHRARNALLARNAAVLVVRDPRDVMVSYYHYAKAKKSVGHAGGIKEIINHPTMGLAAFFRQFDSWRDQAGLILRYEDLKARPVDEFTRLVECLKIPASPEQITSAVQISDMSHMRKAQEQSREFKAKFNSGFMFARSGGSRQWEGLFDEDDMEKWEELKTQHAFTLYS